MVLTETTVKLATGFAGVTMSKPQALASLMLTILLPLCRLKELKKLAPFAMMGIGAIMFTVFAMGLRYAQGAYALGGKFFVKGAAAPAFGAVGASGIFSPAAFVLIGMLATAFSSHYNAPKFYRELRDNTIPRYNTVVGSGYLLAGFTYVLVAAFGFLTFGTASGPMVLNNYAATDGLINVARLAVGLSILTSYPLTFVGVRDSVLDLCKVKNRSNKVLDGVTVALLGTLAILSLLVTDLGAVWAIGGATYGTALTVLIPPFMFVKCVLKKQPEDWKKLRKEIPVAVGTAVLGLAMGAIGTMQAIQKFRVA
jgi:amino acid permease